MKTFPLILALCLAAPLLSGAFARAQEPAKHWVCTSCNSPCDHNVYDHPGTCPACGMPLVEQGTEAPRSRAKVAVLLFDGVEIIDFTGPWEVFGHADFEIYTVAEAKAPITTSMGLTVVPRYTFADAPTPDILLVPGGAVKGARNNPATLKWVAEQAAKAPRTMSVCNGAFILAQAGLLDGLTATTTAPLIDGLKTEFPKVTVVHDRRFVDNGTILTTAGLSAGIDGALHVVSGMLGDGVARSVALDMEYDWRPESEFARAALADRVIPDLDVDARAKWELVTHQGNRDGWEVVVRPRFEIDDGALLEHFAKALTQGKWTRVKAAAGKSDWTFQDGDGHPWRATLAVLAKPGARRAARLTVARAR